VLAIGGAKQRALLAVLLLHPNDAVASDHLVDELWGERPPATAGHTIQVYVSNLRKLLGQERVLRRPTGYALKVERNELDLERFERLLEEGRSARSAGDPGTAARVLRQALSLWRGPALADFTYDGFAQSAVARLEELRLVALEERFEADLGSGRHADLVPELQSLVVQHPLRERLRGQLMVALYGCGRQVEALEAFQVMRRLLVDELGIEPSSALQRLERAILQQDPALEAWWGPEQIAPRPERSILVAADSGGLLERLVAFAEPLTLSPHWHELILGLACVGEAALPVAGAALSELRANLEARGFVARAAAFTSVDPGLDFVRLASEQNVDLVLLGGPAALIDGEFTDSALAVLTDAPCDVVLVFDRPRSGGPVLVPFGGGEHDWAALEFGAWYARALGLELTLLGTTADEQTGRRDASRLLAHSALAVQQLVGVATETALTTAGDEGVLEMAERASVLVVGLADDWAERGLGATRAALVERGRLPVVAVRRGLRPGGLTPRETLTHFTWSLSGVDAGPAIAREAAER
jgi:DNA-binding SARP family transcriptional activator